MISRDSENRLRQLTQRNELLENELRNQMDQCHSLDQKLIEHNQEQMKIKSQKERFIRIYREQQQKYDEIQKRNQQEKRIVEREKNYLSQKQDENRRLSSNLLEKQQQIIKLANLSKRRTDECILLNEKIRIYQMMTDRCEKESQKSLIIPLVIHRIKSLQHENDQLTKRLRLSQEKSLMIVAAHQFQIVKREQIHQMNQNLSNRSIVIHDRSMRTYNEVELKKYPMYVDRLRKIFEDSVRWRRKILSIDQLYYVSDPFFVRYEDQ